MPYLYAVGRSVYDQRNNLVASFHNAWAAAEYAAAVNAGDIPPP
jgi:hypothetical protein